MPACYGARSVAPSGRRQAGSTRSEARSLPSLGRALPHGQGRRRPSVRGPHGTRGPSSASAATALRPQTVPSLGVATDQDLSTAPAGCVVSPTSTRASVRVGEVPDTVVGHSEGRAAMMTGRRRDRRPPASCRAVPHRAFMATMALPPSCAARGGRRAPRGLGGCRRRRVDWAPLAKEPR